MAINDVNDVRAAVARSVAERKISADAVDVIAKQLATVNQKIRAIDICTHGICIDFFIDGKEWWQTLPELATIEGGQLKGIEIFPWGIPFPDILHVRVTQNMAVLPQIGG